jgi:hypothetical protein
MASRSSEVALRFSAEKAEAVRNAFSEITQHGSSAARRLVQDNAMVASSAHHAATAVRVAYLAMASDRPVTAVAALVARIVAGVAAAKLLSAAIGTAREQIQEMVAIADKAGDRGVGGNFFQRFTAEANRLKVSAADLEDALSNALSATREKSPIDLSEWETGKERITEVEKALRVFNATGTTLEGLVLFRDAQDQEQKIMAVLKAMTELQAAGRNLEALQLGELMFGAKFVENIRLGKTSAEQMLQTMKVTGEAATGIFSDEMINRAKEVDNRLATAQNTLSREMRPTMDILAKQILDIRNYWASIVEYMAAAFRWANQIDLAVKRDELAQVNKAIEGGTALYGLPRVPESVRSQFGATKTIEQELIERRDKLQAEVDHLEGRTRLHIVVDSGSRGAGAAPTRRGDDQGATRDRFDGAVDGIEKRIAAMEAETSAIDLGTAARERARIVAELETVAKQANVQAGRENTEVTTEQAEVIQRLADRWAAATEVAEAAKGPLASYAREARDFNAQFQDAGVGALRSIEDGFVTVTKRAGTFADKMRDVADSVISDLLRISARAVTGPLASAVSSGIGSVFNLHTPGGYSHAFPKPFANGGVFTNRIVDRPTLFQFANGGGFGLGEMGEKSEEAIMPLRRGAGGRLGVDASGLGGSKVEVNVINQTSTPVQASTRRSPGRNGGESIDLILTEKVRGVMRDDLASNGPITGDIADRFALDATRGMR